MKRNRELKDLVHTWIRKLLREGKHPLVAVLEEGPEQNLGMLETFWISSIRAAGGKLLNMTDGGEGSFGYRLNDEQKLKISKTHKGKIISEEHRRAISRTFKGVPLSPEHAQKIGDANRGRKFPPEFGERVSKQKKGQIPWNKGKKCPTGFCWNAGKRYGQFRIINRADGLEFESLAAASEHYGIAYQTAWALLRGHRKRPRPEFQFEELP